MRVCFLVPELGRSGGIEVVTGHARRLAAREGFEPELVVTGDGGAAAEGPVGVPVRPLADARESYDLAVATWWATGPALYEVSARARAVFLQSMEERFYRENELFERLGALAVVSLPVHFVAISSWIRDLMAELRPEARCLLVPNGVDKEVFAPRERSPREGPLRVLVEGQPTLWFKGVEDAVRAVRQMSEPADLTLAALDPSGAEELGADRVLGGLDAAGMADLYAETDVLVKLPRVEGLSLPPLEAFHMGVPCVVAPFTGHADYVAHAENGLVVGYDDVAGAAGWLDLLARDRELLARLSAGALATAARWPGPEESTDRLAEALRELAEAPPPPLEQSFGDLFRSLALTTELGRHRVKSYVLLEELRYSRDECAELLEESRRQLEEATSSRAYQAAISMRRLLDRVRR